VDNKMMLLQQKQKADEKLMLVRVVRRGDGGWST
jgi:hypothetical protein